MSEFSARKPYWVKPATLEHIGEAVRHLVTRTGSFAEVCDRATPLISAEVSLEGVENVPEAGPVVVIKNHPCHFDFLMLGRVFEVRPDIRQLTKTSRPASALPASNTLFIRKIGPKGHPDDVKTLQSFLGEGGSLMATPWGAMDHAAAQQASLDRTVQNVVRYAAFANAHVLPVHIDAAWEDDRQLPLRGAGITIREPIMATPEGPDVERIGEAARLMYERYAVQPGSADLTA